MISNTVSSFVIFNSRDPVLDDGRGERPADADIPVYEFDRGLTLSESQSRWEYFRAVYTPIPKTFRADEPGHDTVSPRTPSNHAHQISILDAAFLIDGAPNSISGVQTSINGVPSCINGVLNSIDGDLNCVNGDQNSVDGVPNCINGDPNLIDGVPSCSRGCPR